MVDSHVYRGYEIPVFYDSMIAKISVWGRDREEAVGRGKAALSSVEPRTVLAGGFILFVLFAFPGYMSTDSWTQLIEARAAHYSDAHPPLMSAMWRCKSSVTPAK